MLKPASVLRVAIVGPGLDFTDKQEGHDFYPQQTIQPFAVIDSLMRLGLAAPGGVQVTACDLSPRVIQHLEAARTRARQGTLRTRWCCRASSIAGGRADLTKYWQRFGDRIGKDAKPLAPPPSAGRLEVRAVALPPPVVLSVTPRDLNVVVQRLDPLPAAEQFDLVLATNILLYYDVFEQSLAVTNVAKMLRPGGIFLTNDRLFDLPSKPHPLRRFDQRRLPRTARSGDERRSHRVVSEMRRRSRRPTSVEDGRRGRPSIRVWPSGRPSLAAVAASGVGGRSACWGMGDAGGRHGHAAPQNPWKLPAASPPAFAERVLLRA